MTFIGSILPQEKAYDHMTTIEKMSWSSKNKPTKCYSLVAFFVFLIVIVIYKLDEEKKRKTHLKTLKNLNPCQTLETMLEIVIFWI